MLGRLRMTKSEASLEAAVACPHPADQNADPPARLIRLLACPSCRVGVEPAGPGGLRCTRCGTEYVVRDGVPRMLPGELPEAVAETADAFGWQWHSFPQQYRAFREEALEWFSPITPADFSGISVLDAGCGKGRHALLAAELGAAHVVGLDISRAVDVARGATRESPVIDLVQGDVLTPPLARGAFDLVYSLGVIHHTPEPRAAIQALAACVRPGGTLHVWVYGHEGNAFVRRVVDPLRRQLARRVPRKSVRAGTFPLGVLLTLAARLSRRLDRVPCVPYRAYFRGLSKYSVGHIWAIVYDQLMAPTTHYIKGHELEEWFQAAGLTDIRIRDSRGMSWTGTGRRPSDRATSGPRGEGWSV